MALYRVHVNIALGTETLVPGQLVPESRFKSTALAALVRRGALSMVSAPPLAMMPGAWQASTNALAGNGILTVADLIEANASALAAALGVEANVVTKWQTEAQSWLRPVPRLPS